MALLSIDDCKKRIMRSTTRRKVEPSCETKLLRSSSVFDLSDDWKNLEFLSVCEGVRCSVIQKDLHIKGLPLDIQRSQQVVSSNMLWALLTGRRQTQDTVEGLRLPAGLGAHRELLPQKVPGCKKTSGRLVTQWNLMLKDFPLLVKMRKGLVLRVPYFFLC